MKSLKLFAVVIGFTIMLTGCGTMKGVGEDVTSLGGIISKGSDHYKEAVGKNPPGSKMESKEE